MFEKQPHRHWLMLVLITLKSQPLKRLPRLSGKPYGIVFEFELFNFLIAYAIREMYNYTVDTSDTQM